MPGEEAKLNQDEMKRLVATVVVEKCVQSGMRLGLGSGSTSEYAVRHIGHLYRTGQVRDILGVVTSTQTELVCHELGLPITSLNDPRIGGHLDLAIDGPDQIDWEGNLVKGGGGALTQEKIVGYAADEFIIVADETKVVDRLGASFPVPLEVMPMARVSAARAVERMGGQASVRMAQKKVGAVITDNGNIILDVTFDDPIDPREYEYSLNMIPGVVENGLFTRPPFKVYVAFADGTVELKYSR